MAYPIKVGVFAWIGYLQPTIWEEPKGLFVHGVHSCDAVSRWNIDLDQLEKWSNTTSHTSANIWVIFFYWLVLYHILCLIGGVGDGKRASERRGAVVSRAGEGGQPWCQNPECPLQIPRTPRQIQSPRQVEPLVAGHLSSHNLPIPPPPPLLLLQGFRVNSHGCELGTMVQTTFLTPRVRTCS